MEHIIEKIQKLPSYTYVFEEQEDIDILLLLNSCSVACAEMPKFSGPIIKVAGQTLSTYHCDDSMLPLVIGEIIEKENEGY